MPCEGDTIGRTQAGERRAVRPGQPKANGTLPGQGQRPPVLPGSKLPFYIGLGVAGGIMLIVLIVAAISFSGKNNRPVVKPTPVLISRSSRRSSGEPRRVGPKHRADELAARLSGRNDETENRNRKSSGMTKRQLKSAAGAFVIAVCRLIRHWVSDFVIGRCTRNASGRSHIPHFC